MVRASMSSSADASRLVALQSGDGASGLGAGWAAYEGHSGDIVPNLHGLLGTAPSQLDGARKTETIDLHNLNMLEESSTSGGKRKGSGRGRSWRGLERFEGGCCNHY
jgi:hypothetical protein